MTAVFFREKTQVYWFLEYTENGDSADLTSKKLRINVKSSKYGIRDLP